MARREHPSRAHLTKADWADGLGWSAYGGNGEALARQSEGVTDERTRQNNIEQTWIALGYAIGEGRAVELMMEMGWIPPDGESSGDEGYGCDQGGVEH